MLDALLDEALAAVSESAAWDFKQSFNPTSDHDWLEILKDIAALANSGGGLILFGLLDSGHPVGCSPKELMAVDPAVITDKLFKYTGVHFSNFRAVRCAKGPVDLCALLVNAAEFPLVFQKPGTYALPDGKQRTAFGQGTVYFRHGAKSEPAVSEDMRQFFDRKLEAFRESWIKNIRTVIEAPSDSVFAVMPSMVRLSSSPDAQPIRITHERAAQLLQAPMVDQTHPFRQKEALTECNRRLPKESQLNSHDILCIRRAHQIQRDLKYCYNMNWNSPRYSHAFVDWMVEQVTGDSDFVKRCRQAHGAAKASRNVDDY